MCKEVIKLALKNRFVANDMDEHKIRILDGARYFDETTGDGQETSFFLADTSVIKTAIDETEKATGLPVKMIVIDPISNHWGNIQENNNAEVRSVLKPLARLAEDKNVAIVSIQHIGKSTDREYAQHRILGSTGIIAAHRNVWGVYPYYSHTENSPTEGKHLLLAMVKSNCCVKPTAIEYQVVPPEGKVEIIDCNVEKDGDDIEAENRRNRTDKKETKIAECVIWLKKSSEPITNCKPKLLPKVKIGIIQPQR
ncbi:hypothetical protein FACS189454_09350 [Planctomycetales bacterium]|nr:hypothetical protein FACS189454_09350 [Planctomycetales bacterium]